MKHIFIYRLYVICIQRNILYTVTAKICNLCLKHFLLYLESYMYECDGLTLFHLFTFICSFVLWFAFALCQLVNVQSMASSSSLTMQITVQVIGVQFTYIFMFIKIASELKNEKTKLNPPHSHILHLHGLMHIWPRFACLRPISSHHIVLIDIFGCWCSAILLLFSLRSILLSHSRSFSLPFQFVICSFFLHFLRNGIFSLFSFSSWIHSFIWWINVVNAESGIQILLVAKEWRVKQRNRNCWMRWKWRTHIEMVTHYLCLIFFFV